MKIKYLDIPLDYLPKAGFHESNILKFQATKEKIIIHIFTSPFYNSFSKDKNLLRYINDFEQDSIILELEIDKPKYKFINFNSFYDFQDSEIDFNEITRDGKVIGYELFVFGYPDNRIDVDESKNDELNNKYGMYPLDLKIYGSNIKWKIVGQVSDINFNSKGGYYLDKLIQIYNKDE